MVHPEYRGMSHLPFHKQHTPWTITIRANPRVEDGFHGNDEHLDPIVVAVNVSVYEGGFTDEYF